MKVSELIAELSKLPQDIDVIVSSDPEGNRYRPLSSVNLGRAAPEEPSHYNIDAFYDDEHSDDDCCLGPGEREEFPKVVCLFP